MLSATQCLLIALKIKYLNNPAAKQNVFFPFVKILFYWLCYYSCLNFPLLPPSTQYSPLP